MKQPKTLNKKPKYTPPAAPRDTAHDAVPLGWALYVSMNLIYLIATPVLAYAVYVLYLLFGRDEYSKSQKKAQACLVIFLPIIGPVIVHGMIREFERIPKPRNPNDGQGVDGMPGGTQ